MFVDRLQIISACAEMTWQHETSLCPDYTSHFALLFDLLLVDKDCNHMRTGSEVHIHSYLYRIILLRKK